MQTLFHLHCQGWEVGRQAWGLLQGEKWQEYCRSHGALWVQECQDEREDAHCGLRTTRMNLTCFIVTTSPFLLQLQRAPSERCSHCSSLGSLFSLFPSKSSWVAVKFMIMKWKLNKHTKTFPLKALSTNTLIDTRGLMRHEILFQKHLLNLLNIFLESFWKLTKRYTAYWKIIVYIWEILFPTQVTWERVLVRSLQVFILPLGPTSV